MDFKMKISLNCKSGGEYYNTKWSNSTSSIGAHESTPRCSRYVDRWTFFIIFRTKTNFDSLRTSVQGIPGLQAAQNAAAAQQQNVVMVQPSQNLTSVTSSPSSNGCKFLR